MNILIDGQTLETPEINRGIGVYFKNVLSNMLKLDSVHCFYITVSDENSLNSIGSWEREKLIIVVSEAFNPNLVHTSGYESSDNFSDELNRVIFDNSIDIYWNPNPLMANVLFPTEILECKMVVTIHDLIPLKFDFYIKSWPQHILNEYNRRLELLKNNKIAIISDSDATKNDLMHYIKRDMDSLNVVMLAANSKMFYKKLLKRRLVSDCTEYKIMYTGGFDYRKNMFKAVEAFAKALKFYKTDKVMRCSKFYIVCAYSEESKKELEAHIYNLGISDKVVITGYLSESDLVQMYYDADLYFFPSLYEGFGLPILEAMLAGTFVLTADNSALAEISNGHTLLCNANDVKDMAKKIYKALHKSIEESIEDKKIRQEYALSFSWEKTALGTLNVLKELLYPRVKIDSKKKLAIITPWPMQKSGIANYMYKLVPYLAEYFSIDIYVDDKNAESVELVKNPCGELYSISEFESKHKNYDSVLYEIGNNSNYHTETYKLSQKIKGFVEVHDYNIHPFIQHSFLMKNDFETYKKALVGSYGKEGYDHYENVVNRVCEPDILRYPLVQHLIKNSICAIVHNFWCYRQVSEFNNVRVITLPSYLNDECIVNDEDYNKFLYKLKINKDKEFVIGCFGFINSNKRPDKIISAVYELRKNRYPVKLFFFGENNCIELENEVCKSANFVNITGYLNKQEYIYALNASDIIINLRHPSMGESSGTLAEAFRAGKPVILSNVNQYKEFPDDVCWKVDVGENEVEQLVMMIKWLLKNKDVRNAIGANARSYADTVLDPNTLAFYYYKCIDN